MDFNVRVRIVQDLALSFDVPEEQRDPVEDVPEERVPGEELTNAKAVYAARRGAAKAAEKLARDTYPDAVEVIVEEVTEVE